MNGGESAFPQTIPMPQYGEGLTKREWIAATVLPAIIRDKSGFVSMTPYDIVNEAVKYADDLIRYLNENPTQ